MSKARAVIQYDLQGNEVVRYRTVTEASKSISPDYIGVGTLSSYIIAEKPFKGFIWKYADTVEVPVKEEKTEIKPVTAVIIQQDVYGNVCGRYSSIEEASKATGFKASNIKRAIASYSFSGNYSWSQKELNKGAIVVLKDGKVIKECKSTIEAGKYAGVSDVTVNNLINSGKATKRGYSFTRKLHYLDTEEEWEHFIAECDRLEVMENEAYE